MVGSIMHAMVCTRPNIAYVVIVVRRFMSNPKQSHCQTLKWILHYMKLFLVHDFSLWRSKNMLETLSRRILLSPITLGV